MINTDPHQASNSDIRSIKIYYEQVRMTDDQYSIMLTQIIKLKQLSLSIAKFNQNFTNTILKQIKS